MSRHAVPHASALQYLVHAPLALIPLVFVLALTIPMPVARASQPGPPTSKSPQGLDIRSLMQYREVAGQTMPAPVVVVSVVTQRGDTLSDLAKKDLGSSNLWPELWWQNRTRIKNPEALQVGTKLQLPADPEPSSAILHAAMAAIPKPKPPPNPPVGGINPPASTSPVASAPIPAPVTSSGDAAHSALGDCIRNAEEGGSYVWGPGNGGGAYQFLLGTWETYGGAASMYGVAGPAYQDQIFDNAINAGGASNWTLYDGC
jgi:LysM domain